MESNTLKQAFALIQSNELETAKNILEKLLKKNANEPNCLFGLGVIAYLSKDSDQAERFFKEVLKNDSQHKASLDYLSQLYCDAKRWDDAILLTKKILDFQPDNAISLRNLGFLYQQQDLLQPAIRCYEKALAIEPNYPECLMSLGITYQAMELREKAQDFYKKALQLKPVFPQCEYNLSNLQLLLTNFDEGWQSYQARKSVLTLSIQPSEKIPLWDGIQSLKNKKIFVLPEQGYGDYIQFIRFAERLKEQGATVIAVHDQYIEEIIKTVPWVDEVYTPTRFADNTEGYQVLIIDLAKYFKINAKNIPNKVPYIFAEKTKAKKISPLFETKKSIKIGVSWLGNPEFANDSHRSTCLKTLAPLLHYEKAAFFSLTVNDRHDELTHFKDHIMDMRPFIRDFSDTAAIIENLDLVISTDTVIVHLAAAMNKPCWALLAKIPDWRWQLNRSDSPWYPSVRLFRQKDAGDWDFVMQQVVASLRHLK